MRAQGRHAAKPERGRLTWVARSHLLDTQLNLIRRYEAVGPTNLWPTESAAIAPSIVCAPRLHHRRREPVVWVTVASGES